MDIIDDIIENCIECGACGDACSFLTRTDQTPVELATNLKDGLYKEKSDIPYLCNLCDLCQELCPLDLNIGKMCMELRQKLVCEGKGPLPGHRFVKANQDWSISDAFTLAQPDQQTGSCERVFLPGCSLPGYSPSLVIQTYNYIRQKLPGTGIVLNCCGDQARALGETDNFESILKNTLNEITKLGTSQIIVACPLCYRTFKDYAPELNLSFLIDILLEIGVPEGANVNNKLFSLHDSCALRWETGVHESVRSLVKKMGHEIDEMEFSRELTRCCGLGGMITFVNPQYATSVIKQRTEEASHDMLTYCASCREAFAMSKPSIHILDLIFNPDWENDMKKPPKKAATRRENQALLKTHFKENA